MNNTAEKAAAPASLVLRNMGLFSSLGAVQREALGYLSDKTLDDISKGYATACAVAQFKTALDDKAMAPIMALQGNPVGFVTDKDKQGGYDVATVRDCVITAFMLGLRLHGNEFNIISNRCYVTVNACDRLLAELCAEPRKHEPGIVELDLEKKRGLVDYKLTYRLRGKSEGETHSQRVAVKLQFSREGSLVTTDDAVIGKARRKVLWSVLRAVRGFDLGADAGETEKNVTPGGAAQTKPKSAAVRSAFDTAPVVDLDTGEVTPAATEGGAA